MSSGIAVLTRKGCKHRAHKFIGNGVAPKCMTVGDENSRDKNTCTDRWAHKARVDRNLVPHVCSSDYYGADEGRPVI